MQYIILVLSVKIFFIRPQKSTRLHLRAFIFQSFSGGACPSPEFLKTLLPPPDVSEIPTALYSQVVDGGTSTFSLRSETECSTIDILIFIGNLRFTCCATIVPNQIEINQVRHWHSNGSTYKSNLIMKFGKSYSSLYLQCYRRT